jgi:hypothetical protein
MPTARHIAGGIVAVAVLTSLPVAPGSTAFAAGPLADIAFAVGDEELFSGDSPGGGRGENGTWTFKSGRIADGRLKLHFEIDPKPPSLPLRSGPAVLFAGLEMYGDAGGDVGLSATVPTVVHKAIPTCADDADCHYSVDIAIPTDQIGRTIERLERDGRLMSVSATLTLVRTYGGGQWLEILPFLSRPEGTRGSSAGRVGAMTSVKGEMFWSGLFPASRARPIEKGDYGLAEELDYAAIAERVRQRLGDDSTPIEMVDVDLDVRISPECDYYSELWLHEDGRAHLFHTLAYGKEHVERRTVMPVGVPFFLTLSGGGGVEPPAARLGPILSNGSAVRVSATFDCDQWTGALELVGAAAPTASPTAVPPSPRPSVAPASTTPTAGVVAPSPTTSASAAPSPPAEPTSDALPAVPVLVAIVLLAVAGLVGFAAIRGRSGHTRP